MKNYTAKEIHSLIERFEKKELPKLEWTHEAHLVVAIWYCSYYDFAEAMNLVRLNIKSHNESVGTPNTKHEGYHESISMFWMIIAKVYLKKNIDISLELNCNHFINSKWGGSNVPLKYYSKDLLFSVKARLEWIEPDLKSINYEL